MTASTVFLLLLVLACPLMMMWMTRGGHGHGGHAHHRSGHGGADHGDGLDEQTSAAELRRLRDTLDRLIKAREAEEEKESTPVGGGLR